INKRYHAIISANKALFAGKHVLDIASHDGRWSFAALEAGCASVVGIEGRRHFVDSANANFRQYGIESSRYDFICADAIDYLKRNRIRADVVLLLGFFYHINCHAELAALMAQTGASHIILDTGVAADAGPVIRLTEEPTSLQSNAIGEAPTAIVGSPSREAIDMIFRHVGFAAQEIDWMPILNEYGPEGVEDYASRNRTTFVLRRSVQL
ncbi:MAG: methyltransferase domain-containing protein, partial [Terriglobia bacterium]